MTDTYVRYERRGAVLVATLDRPALRNAYDGPGLKAIGAIGATLDADPDLRVAVVTGAGGDFCTGANIQAVASGGFDDPPYPEVADGLAAKPVIAAIEGMCLGGGMMISAGADLRVAGTSARFAVSEARWNLPAQWLGALARQMAPGHVLELAMLADERFTAQRLEAMGWLNRVVPDGEALGFALGWADRIAAMAPAAIRFFKELITKATYLPPEDATALGLRQSMQLIGMEDTIEGGRAFAERRQPAFRDR